MNRREDLTLLISGIVLVLVAVLVVVLEPRWPGSVRSPQPAAIATGLLSDPFLQSPTEDSVRVVWFTEFEGRDHTVIYGNLPGQALSEGNVRQVFAETQRVFRLQEDQDSRLPSGDTYDRPTPRLIWRHNALVTGLTPGERVPYQVKSLREDGAVITSGEFSLAPAPPPGQPLNILLTSDHQQKPMTAANLQKVAETIGPVDAVFLAGDLVNVPDRASEWFDDAEGGAFFPALQGRANAEAVPGGPRYRGGALIQSAPLFPAIGNHEVMGRVSALTKLNDQFNDPVPRRAAIALYNTRPEVFNPTGDPDLRRRWIIDQSYNTDTYEQIFSLPSSRVPNPERSEFTSRYYATTLGDVRLVSLFAANIWRNPQVNATRKGRYQEALTDLNNPGEWGYGQHIFEPLEAGSLQYTWLQEEINSLAFQQAKYRVVMLHHPPHSLGDNVVPAFADPVAVYDRSDRGTLDAIRYEYPLENDVLIRDVMPMLEAAGVDLVFYGHSHIWNRFVSPNGTHYLESSNVGNTYGAYWQGNLRQLPPMEDGEDFFGFRGDFYVPQGDPNGLDPVMPAIAPLTRDNGEPLPYIASNEITAFSILNTGTGTVSSYYFDTTRPNSNVVKFDEFALGAG